MRSHGSSWSYVSVLQSLLVPSLWPAFSEAYLGRDIVWISKTYGRVMRATLVTVGVGSPVAWFCWTVDYWFMGGKGSSAKFNTAMVYVFLGCFVLHLHEPSGIISGDTASAIASCYGHARSNLESRALCRASEALWTDWGSFGNDHLLPPIHCSASDMGGAANTSWSIP